jgi:hypothetical protein
MKLFVFSIAILTLITAGAFETAQAVPMMPLPSEMASDAGTATITQVRYYHHRYRHHGYLSPAIGTTTARTGRAEGTASSRPDKNWQSRAASNGR